MADLYRFLLMSKRQLTEVPLFPEVSKKKTSRSKGPTTFVSSSSNVVQTESLGNSPFPQKVFSIPSRRPRFPRRTVCTDDIPSLSETSPFDPLGNFSSSFGFKTFPSISSHLMSKGFSTVSS